MSTNKYIVCSLFLLISLNINTQEYDGVLEEDIYIKLEFTDCLRGSFCPDYEITILGNGTMIYEGIRHVSNIGVFQKQIKKQEIADLLTQLLRIRFFQRTDESTDCNTSIKLIDGGNYEKREGLCTISSHGPFTGINIKFGTEKREVDLEHYFSDDYLRIKQKIIETAGVSDWIGSE